MVIECLKTHQILCRTVWTKKLDFKTFRIHHHFWSLWTLQKKLFLKSQQVTSNPNSEWSKLHITMMWVCFSFYMIRGFRLVVIRTLLDPPIRFYCRKMKNSSFFRKWYSKSVENYFHFCSFWEPHWSRFRLKIFFRATTCIIYVFRTSLWSHSFATK